MHEFISSRVPAYTGAEMTRAGIAAYPMDRAIHERIRMHTEAKRL